MAIRPDKSTENGATVVVPVRLEDHKWINGTYTTISSCYTKEHKGKPNDKWFVRQIEKGNLIYFNKKSHDMLEITDDNGATVVTPVRLEKRKIGKRGKTYTKITSFYTKEHGGTPNTQWFMNQIDKNRLIYCHKKRVPLGPMNAGWVISLFENAGPSTLLHETAYVFFEEIEEAINTGLADEGMMADYQALQTGGGF